MFLQFVTVLSSFLAAEFLTYGFLARSGLWALLRQPNIDGVCVLTQNRRCSVESLGELV